MLPRLCAAGLDVLEELVAALGSRAHAAVAAEGGLAPLVSAVAPNRSLSPCPAHDLSIAAASSVQQLSARLSSALSVWNNMDLCPMSLVQQQKPNNRAVDLLVRCNAV